MKKTIVWSPEARADLRRIPRGDAMRILQAIDRFVNNSEVATDIKNTFFNGNPEYFRDKVQQLVEEFNLSTDDIKDLSIAALIAKMLGMTGSDQSRSQLGWLQQMAGGLGLSDNRVATLQLDASAVGKSGKNSKQS